MISRFHPAGPLHRAFSAACALIAGAVLVSAAPGLAQQRTVATDDDGAEPVATTSVPVVQSVAPSPTRTLNAALAKLARDPRDVTALLDAGGAALDLGDTDAAIGFLTRAELVALYGEMTGRDMTAMPWFAVLGCYKLACILEGSYARACAGKMDKAIGEQLHTYALWLMARAQQIIGTGRV